MAAAKPAPAWQSVALTDGDKAFVEALAGAIGSVVGTWCFYPLDTLKTRLQVRLKAPLCLGPMPPFSWRALRDTVSPNRIAAGIDARYPC